MYRDAFRRNNFEVYEAEDGQTGIDMALTSRPQAIVLDLMLPRQGGLGALKIIRSLPDAKHIPIIILTALPNPEYVDAAKPFVQGYFLKTNIKPSELVNKVRELISEN